MFIFFTSSQAETICCLYLVCTSCYGREPNCSGDTSKCPWNVELAANVAAIVTAGSTAWRMVEEEQGSTCKHVAAFLWFLVELN